jgi:hypothetical protein
MGWMASWTNESVYSKDLRQKIVDAIQRGMPKAEAARTFGVGISTVKRYATKAPNLAIKCAANRWSNDGRKIRSKMALRSSQTA